MATPWSPTELEMLLSLIGDYPFTLAVRHYNKWAIENSYTTRTAGALRVKANKNGLGITSYGYYIDCPAIAQLVGLSGETVRRWVRDGHLIAYREGIKYYVSRKNLRHFARRFPAAFAGLPVATLVELFSSEAVAAEFAAMPPRKVTGKNRAVRCVETGQTYPSLKAAAAAHYVCRQAITTALVKGRTSADVHWRVVGPDPYRPRLVDAEPRVKAS